MHTTKKLLIIAAVAAAVPSTASAATVSVNGSAIEFVAAPGEANQVFVTRPGPDRLDVHESHGGLVAGEGCSTTDGFTVECS
ncbi:MAG: hypothetical protein QOK00_3344, partial [Thermoleophilaceae bacterium]|nr:hypothetical protein [Thermoleophilaceae bacterium]